MRPHDWATLVAVGAPVLAVVAILRGNLPWAAAMLLVTVGAACAARRWSRKYPGPMPYLLRWVLLLPRGPHAPRHLDRILEPQPGQRILEIGPGIGVHALHVAASLAPGGVLDVLDTQQPMLDELMRRAREAGLTTIVPTRGDAHALPYADGIFDAAYLISVLGEIPDQRAALRELRRVLKPSGRLVIGETVADPDYVSGRSLQDECRRTGFVFERRDGSAMAYLARFRRALSPASSPTGSSTSAHAAIHGWPA